MAILCQNTVSLSNLSSSLPLRNIHHLPPRSPSPSCPECINQSLLLPRWKNISTPVVWGKFVGRRFFSPGCRATDSKKPPSVSGSEISEDQDAMEPKFSNSEDLEEKINDRLAGIDGGLMAKLPCEKEKEAQELQNLAEETMADDQGRSPGDYNRRAHLFDKSAQIFTSLNHGEEDHDHQDAPAI